MLALAARACRWSQPFLFKERPRRSIQFGGAGGGSVVADTRCGMELTHLLAIGLPVQTLQGSRAKSSTAPAPTAQAQKAAPKPVPADKPSGTPAVAKPKAKAAVAAAAAPAQGVSEVRSMAPANALTGPAAQKTRQLYLDDTYLFEHPAVLLDVWEDGDKVCVELDQTIFHPQGGGQPSDVGTITAQGLPPLEVVFVSMDKTREGLVRHDCKGDLAAWKAAAAERKAVTCQVDEQKRRIFARVHSAGHLLDVAVHDLGFTWQPGKGYHFPDGPYVEYLVTEDGRKLDNKDPKGKQAVLEELGEKMRELIAKNTSVKVSYLDGIRQVAFEDVSCGCGGTHVPTTGDLGEVTIKKLQAKSGNMRVSYTLAA